MGPWLDIMLEPVHNVFRYEIIADKISWIGIETFTKLHTL
jgi:hypothetical protein